MSDQTRPVINILLLGETGVGKSTLINAFVNYLAYNSLDEAKRGHLLSLIPCSFTLTDDNFDERLIQFGGTNDNESDIPGQSVTQHCKSYVFPYGDRNVRLIDTPGIGDTRGVDQDKLNFAHILEYLSQYQELHCICILLKPNNSRLTVTFEFCINQLLTNLQKSAAKNIVFLFTNVRGTFYRPGDTAPALMAILNQVRQSPPYVDIQFNKSTIYCLDNEAFRFLVALNQGFKFQEHEVENFDKSWSVSAKECERLLAYVIGTSDGAPGLTPHPVRHTVCVNEARRMIMGLAHILPPLVDMMLDNVARLKNKRDQIDRDNQVDSGVVDLVVPDQTSMKTRVYRCRRHDNCQITYGIKMSGTLDNMFTMMNIMWKCPRCKCGANYHYSFTNITKLHHSVKIADDSKHFDKDEACKIIRNEINKLNKLVNTILSVSVKLNLYVKNNSIVPYYDRFKDDLDQMSQSMSDDPEKTDLLKDFLRQYDEEMARCESEHGTLVSVDQAFQMIEQLDLGQYGSQFRQILDNQEVCTYQSEDVNVKIEHDQLVTAM